MELLTGDRWIPVSDSFSDQTNLFSGSVDGCEWTYDHRQHLAAFPTPTVHGDNAIADKAPPQKLQPVRCSGRGFYDEQDQSQMPCAGYLLERLPELGLQATKVDDAVHNGGLIRHGSALDSENIGLSSGRGSDWGDMSLSSSLNCVDESSAGAAPRKRKRNRRSKGKLERFLEKLVERIMERQEQMHKQLIEVIETNEKERIQREEAWKHQEIERMKRDEEARTQEMSRSIALTSFIEYVLGHKTEIANPLDVLADQNKNGNDRDVQFEKDLNGGNDCSSNSGQKQKC